eukprot:SAG31_NODE_5418_length_2549_cov_1.620816_1_plen_586_part_00
MPTCFRDRWLFQDILGASNGLVDYMFQPKMGAGLDTKNLHAQNISFHLNLDPHSATSSAGALNPSNIKKIVDPVVLVLSTGVLWKEKEQSAVYTSGETLESTLLVSNYWPSNLTDCTATWSAMLVPPYTSRGKMAVAQAAPFAHGSHSVVAIAQGTVVDLTPLQIVLPSVAAPTQFNLSATLSCTGAAGFRQRTNDWQAWIYPEVKPLLQLPDGVAQKSSAGDIFASPSILHKVQTVAPDAKLLPSAPPLSANDLYVASQQDIQGAMAKSWSQVLAAVKAGSTLLIPEFPQCDERSCPTAPFEPLVQSPLLFHSPWWTNDAVTPTALYVPLPEEDDEGDDDGDDQEELPSLAVPTGIRAMATTADGHVDNGWFAGFGPVPSACLRPPPPPPPPPPLPRDKWPCPSAFPYPAAVLDSYLCYTKATFANATGGPCGSWCTLCNTGTGCGPPSTHRCKAPGGNPSGGPGFIQQHCPHAAGPGPHVRAGAAFKPGNSSLSFKQWLDSRGGKLWLGAVYSSNFPSPSVGAISGSPLGGSIFAVPEGAGRIIVSGVSLDLTECHRGPEPHKLFDETLLKVLLEAGSGAMTL